MLKFLSLKIGVALLLLAAIAAQTAIPAPSAAQGGLDNDALALLGRAQRDVRDFEAVRAYTAYQFYSVDTMQTLLDSDGNAVDITRSSTTQDRNLEYYRGIRDDIDTQQIELDVVHTETSVVDGAEVQTEYTAQGRIIRIGQTLYGDLEYESQSEGLNLTAFPQSWFEIDQDDIEAYELLQDAEIDTLYAILNETRSSLLLSDFLSVPEHAAFIASQSFADEAETSETIVVTLSPLGAATYFVNLNVPDADVAELSAALEIDFAEVTLLYTNRRLVETEIAMSLRFRGLPADYFSTVDPTTDPDVLLDYEYSLIDTFFIETLSEPTEPFLPPIR